MELADYSQHSVSVIAELSVLQLLVMFQRQAMSPADCHVIIIAIIVTVVAKLLNR